MKSIREEEKPEVRPIQSGPDKILVNKDLLPSRGRYYKGELYARKLSAIEMKNLSKVRVETVNPVFNQIISSAISGIDLGDVMINDKLWLIYFLRSITYDDFPMKVVGTCPSCGKSHVHEFKLKDLDVIYAPDEMPSELELPNGDKVTVRFPTIETEIEISRTKNNPAFVEDIDEETMTIAAHITSINGESVGIYEAYTYFARGKGSAKDFSRLTNYLKKYAFGARPSTTYTCSCGVEVQVEVPMTRDFFLPEI
jgi:hypothetical protein